MVGLQSYDDSLDDFSHTLFVFHVMFGMYTQIFEYTQPFNDWCDFAKRSLYWNANILFKASGIPME